VFPANGPGKRVSEDTVAGGILAAPGPAARNVTRPVPPGAEPHRLQADEADEADKKAEPARKGRSKVILAGVVLLSAFGITYGAGLLMDHSDVPAGTTVLGVNIGGMTRQHAIQTLESALGSRLTDPITLKVGPRADKLNPSVAGLGLAVDATVGSVAHRDYNPVWVIDSLFGGTRAATPTWQFDNEKLNAQLRSIAAKDSSSGSDGMIKFVAGKAVAVPGKPHTVVNADGSAAAQIRAAYQQHVATGQSSAVSLPVTTVQPKVTQAQLDAALNGFAKTAMSGMVYIEAGPSLTVPFSPQFSLSLFLTMVPDDQGNLQPYFDLQALKNRYKNAFSGVLVARGNGTKTAITPQDVASAMLPALRQTDPAKRVGKILGVVP
jgi:hypothetical protein